MAENVLIFSLTSLVLVLSIISGVCYFLRFPKFDSDEVKAFLQGNTSSGSPIVVGHRGTTNDAPENTLTAFKVAAESGAIGVEFDVDFTKDGHAVIIHDETVDRTTNGQGRVCDLTLESIRKLNALGEFKDSNSFPFTQIPTLEETIKTCLDLNIKMFIEVKAYKDSVKVRKADPSILVAQNWIKYHMSYNRDGTPKNSQWWMTLLARAADFVVEFSVHTWLFDILNFPVLVTHHSEASGQFVNSWKNSNVNVIVYGVFHAQERDYFTHLGCPVIVDKVRDLA